MPASLYVGGYAKLTAKFLQDAFYKEHGLTRDSIGLLEQTYVSNGNQTYEVRFSASCCIPIASFKLEPTATPPPLPNLLQRLAVGQHVTLSQGVDAGSMEFYATHGEDLPTADPYGRMPLQLAVNMWKPSASHACRR